MEKIMNNLENRVLFLEKMLESEWPNVCKLEDKIAALESEVANLRTETSKNYRILEEQIYSLREANEENCEYIWKKEKVWDAAAAPPERFAGRELKLTDEQAEQVNNAWDEQMKKLYMMTPVEFGGGAYQEEAAAKPHEQFWKQQNQAAEKLMKDFDDYKPEAAAKEAASQAPTNEKVDFAPVLIRFLEQCKGTLDGSVDLNKKKIFTIPTIDELQAAIDILRKYNGAK